MNSELFSFANRINILIDTSTVDEDRKLEYDERVNDATTFGELAEIKRELYELQPSPRGNRQKDINEHLNRFIL